jgi:hypothetical protein
MRFMLPTTSQYNISVKLRVLGDSVVKEPETLKYGREDNKLEVANSHWTIANGATGG